MRNVHVFLNPKSGRGQAGRDQSGRDQIATLLTRHGITAQFTALSRGVNVKALAAAAPLETAFVAAGGDGTVNCIANALTGTGRTMGVLPVGTLNHFARDLGVPAGLEAAVAVLAAGHTRAVDAGEVNGHIFVNNASLGAYPRMVVERERMKHGGWNKWASLVLASARAFLRFHCLQINLIADGKQHTASTPFLFVGNNAYTLDGLNSGERQRLDDGQLALYLAPGARRSDILRMAAEALVGRVREDPVYQELRGETFTVSARGRRRLRVALDGELMHVLCPLHFRSLPAALNVLCPAEPIEEEGA